MSYRFSRRIKICKGVHLNVSKSGIGVSLGVRGASISTGPRGTYANVGLPGTGLSYRKKIDNKSYSSDEHYSASDIREQEYIPGSTLELQIEADGKETLYMKAPDGTVFMNETVLRRVKRSDEYKGMVSAARKKKYDFMKEKNDSCVEIYKSTPKIITEEEVIEERNNPAEIKQKYYRVKRFEVPHPNETALYDEAHSWAFNNVKNAKFWNRKRLITEATQNKLRELFDQAKTDWIKQKDEFLDQERINKEKKDKEYEIEYNKAVEERAKTYDLILNPDDNYLLETVDFVLSQIELPVDFSIDYSVENKEIELDIDLPEIEDFPQTYCSILSSGKLSIKKKTVSDLNKDYATGVVGMSFFFAGLLFNISPKIEKISMAGYTQRTSKKSGNIEDQYVYNVTFTRKEFSELNIQNIDPLEAIKNFEHVIDITSKYELKTIPEKESPNRKTSTDEQIDTDDNVMDSTIEETNTNNESNDSYCYSPQQVIDDYDSDFVCVALSDEVLSENRKKNQKAKFLGIFWTAVILGIIGAGCYYYFSTADERNFNNTMNNIMTSADTTIMATFEHEASTHYYIKSIGAPELPESFYLSIYELCKDKNPKIFILNSHSNHIAEKIDSFYDKDIKIPDDYILQCGDELVAIYNLNNEQNLLKYPLKETDLYKEAQQKKKKQEEQIAKANKERIDRQRKIKTENYLYTQNCRQIESTKINPNKGVKGNTKTEWVDVKCIYAYCPKGTSAQQLLDDIKEIEGNGRIYIYIYDKKYSSSEIQKGQIDGHKDYTYVRQHLIKTWFYNK